MPKTTGYKYYKKPGGAHGFEYEIVPDVGGQDFGALGYQELTSEQFKTETQAINIPISGKGSNPAKLPQGGTYYDLLKTYDPQLETKLAAGAVSPYVMQDEVPIAQKSLEQQQQLASDPNMINVGTAEAPLYVPKGSPAAQQIAGQPVQAAAQPISTEEYPTFTKGNITITPTGYNPETKLYETNFGLKSAEDLKKQGFTQTAPSKPTGEISIDKVGDTAALDKSEKMDSKIANIQQTVDKYTLEAGANKEFVNGVVFAATGKDATQEQLNQWTGKTLREVINGFNLAGQIEGADVTPPEEGIKWKPGLSEGQKQGIKDLIQNKPREKWTETDVANYNFATGSSEKVITAEVSEGVEGAAPSFEDIGTQVPSVEPTTTQNYLSEKLNELSNFKITGIRENAIKEQEIVSKQERVRTLESDLDTMKNEMDFSNILNIKAAKKLKDELRLTEEGLRDEPIPMSIINRAINEEREKTGEELSAMSDEQILTQAVNVYKYNSKLIEYKVAAGRLSDAQSIVQQTAQDFKDMTVMQLQYLQLQNQIDSREAKILQAEADREYNLAIEGYTYISNFDDLADYVKQYGEQRIMTLPDGKKYLKPDAGITRIITVEGRLKGLDDKGNVIKDYGLAEIEKPASITEQLAAAEAGYNINNGQIFSKEAGQDPITGVPSDPTKRIGEYDFTSYATDPNWGNAVNNIISQMPDFTSTEEANNYIQQIAPNSPIKAEDIQEISQAAGIAPELMMAILQQESQFGTAGVGARGNNPANIGNTDSLVAAGQMRSYTTIKDGIQALAQNIQRRKIDILDVPTADTKFPTDKDIENLTLEERNVMQAIMRLLPTKLKDALQEKKERQKEVIFSYRQGKTFQTIADEFQGFILAPEVSEEDKLLAFELRAMATGTDLDLRNISAPINLGQPVKAMTNVENANLAEAQGELSEISASRALIKGADRVLSLINNVPVKYLGAFDGRKFKIEKMFGLSDKDAQKTQQLETAMVNLLNEIRRKSLGTAVTESEVKFLEPLLTSLLDQPEIIKTKMNELKEGTMIVHNEARGTVNLPQINQEQLLDNNLRLELYRDAQISGQILDPFNILNEADPLELF